MQILLTFLVLVVENCKPERRSYQIGVECELNIEYVYPLKPASNDIKNWYPT